MDHILVRGLLMKLGYAVRGAVLAAALLALALGLGGAPGRAAMAQEPGLTADELRQGGYVIFFRHVTADDGQDQVPVNLLDCATQRNIREAGLRDARLIGVAFRTLAFPVETVYASEICRAQETAHIAFGRSVTVPALNLCCIDGKPLSNEARLETVQQMVAQAPPDGTNTVIVAHGVGIVADLDMGEAAIYRPDGRGGAMRVARVLPREWMGGSYRADRRAVDSAQ
jgi:phosphohistidine phosphatase SixA